MKRKFLELRRIWEESCCAEGSWEHVCLVECCQHRPCLGKEWAQVELSGSRCRFAWDSARCVWFDSLLKLYWNGDGEAYRGRQLPPGKNNRVDKGRNPVSWNLTLLSEVDAESEKCIDGLRLFNVHIQLFIEDVSLLSHLRACDLAFLW